MSIIVYIFLFYNIFTIFFYNIIIIIAYIILKDSDIMKERDMMYGGYYEGVPGNSMQMNFGYQGPPGALLNIPNPYINSHGNNNSYLENNPFSDINNRLNELEIKINNLEQKINKDNDDSIYML